MILHLVRPGVRLEGDRWVQRLITLDESDPGHLSGCFEGPEGAMKWVKRMPQDEAKKWLLGE